MSEPQHLWHPFANMAAIAGEEFVVERGVGASVFDAQGREYLDASAGLWYCNVGHGRAELAQAAAAQMRRLAAYQIFDRFANQPALTLAARLCDLTPMGDGAAVFLANSGSEAIDTAAKIVRRFWSTIGEPERRIIVSRDGAYHGVNGFGTSLSGIPANTLGWGPLITDTLTVERDSVDALRDVLKEHRGRVAALIAEPVQAASGVYPPVPGYWEAVQALCDEENVLLVLDEVVTGFGRLGTWFGADRFEIQPDLLVMAKGLSSGYLPIGGVVASAKITSALWAESAGAFRHGYTYSGHPTACAVALANLDILEREQLVERVARLEPVMADVLAELAEHELVHEVRTIGLLGGIELAADALCAVPDLTEKVVAKAREHGVLVRNLLGRTIQVSPPFVITEEELALIASSLRGALDHAVYASAV